MAWDWEADDINEDEDSGREWVPTMPQILETGVTTNIMRVAQSTMLRMPPHQMVMYLVQLS